MSNYIMVDGQLVKSNPEARRWLKRAGRAVPQKEESEGPGYKSNGITLGETGRIINGELIIEDRRSDYEVLEGMEETPS